MRISEISSRQAPQLRAWIRHDCRSESTTTFYIKAAIEDETATLSKHATCLKKSVAPHLNFASLQ